MDREGFVENEAFVQLVEVVRAGIEFLALVDKNELLRRKEEAAAKAAKAVRADFRAAISNIQKSPSLTRGDKARLVEHYSNLSKKLEEVEQYGREARRKLEIMSLLGVVAGFMTHEAIRILDGLDLAIQSLRKFADKDPTLKSHLETIEESYSAFKGHVDYTSLFIEAVHRNEIKAFKAAPQVRRIIERFDSFARDRALVVKTEVPADLLVKHVAVPAYSGVLLNLYTNALKSVLATGKKTKAPHIVFRAWNEDGRHIVEVIDRGVGVPEELRQRVFDPLFTTTSNVGNPLGSGMGLGLSLVKEVMGHVGGKIAVVDPPNGYSACFRVEFAGGDS
jgi:signal transduction histidine kinase